MAVTETKCVCCRLTTRDDELYVDSRSMAYIYGMRDAFILLSKDSTLLPVGFCLIHGHLFNAAMEAVRVAGVAGRQNAESPPLPRGSEGLAKEQAGATSGANAALDDDARNSRCRSGDDDA